MILDWLLIASWLLNVVQEKPKEIIKPVLEEESAPPEEPSAVNKPPPTVGKPVDLDDEWIGGSTESLAAEVGKDQELKLEEYPIYYSFLQFHDRIFQLDHDLQFSCTLNTIYIY